MTAKSIKREFLRDQRWIIKRKKERESSMSETSDANCSKNRVAFQCAGSRAIHKTGATTVRHKAHGVQGMDESRQTIMTLKWRNLRGGRK